MQQYDSWQYQPEPEYLPVQPKPPLVFHIGKRELIYGLLLLISAFCLCNFILYGGFNLGFAIAFVASVSCTFFYLLASGKKIKPYSAILLFLSVVIAAGFARSDDGFVKFVMLGFLFVAVNQGLCLQAGQNLWSAGSFGSLLDVFRVSFGFSFGNMAPVFRGFGECARRSGSFGKKGGAFLLGLGICIPFLAIMTPLLISADAAFDGLMKLLPDFELDELFSTVVLGAALWLFLYVRGTALHYRPEGTPKTRKGKGISAITVNTVLWAVALLYMVYLLSQLAYLFGGFAGILPEGYSTAEYARRGFFEMSCLCGVNLTVTVLALGLVRREGKAPLMTRLLCLFVCVVNLFLVATASAKMFMYIGTYGLTRLRVLTQIIMLFMALATLVMAVWLFVPKLPYMRFVLIVALLLGAATIWADVNTQVANYNVDAYLSGKHETVDIAHLISLGDAATDALLRLQQEAPDADVRKQASRLNSVSDHTIEDFREWNYVNHSTQKYREKPEE